MGILFISTHRKIDRNCTKEVCNYIRSNPERKISWEAPKQSPQQSKIQPLLQQFKAFNALNGPLKAQTKSNRDCVAVIWQHVKTLQRVCKAQYMWPVSATMKKLWSHKDWSTIRYFKVGLQFSSNHCKEMTKKTQIDISRQNYNVKYFKCKNVFGASNRHQTGILRLK